MPPERGPFLFQPPRAGACARGWLHRRHGGTRNRDQYAEDRFLEHQLGAVSHRDRRALPARSLAGHTVPAGNQGDRRRFSRPRRSGRSAIPISSCTASGCTTAWRSSAAYRWSRTIDSTGRRIARRGTSACGWPTACGSRMSMSPPAAMCPTASVNPKFGQKLDFVERMTRWSEGLNVPTLLVGDFNIAPLEFGRVEPQAIARCRQPYADRGRRARRAQASERLGRSRPAFRAPRPSGSSPGGATGPRTGSRRIAAGGSIICGRRADVARTAIGHRVFEDCRSWLKPSDHVPIMTEFAA